MGDDKLEKVQRFSGTNCKNCRFYLGKSEVDAKRDELNEQGGLDPKTPEQMSRSKAADLITLPGDNITLKKAFCTEPTVKMMVTPKMCCKLWDHGEAIRPWEDLSKAEEQAEIVDVPHSVVMANSMPHRREDD